MKKYELDVILQMLNNNHQRAIYGAIAELLGTNGRGIVLALTALRTNTTEESPQIVE